MNLVNKEFMQSNNRAKVAYSELSMPNLSLVRKHILAFSSSLDREQLDS